MFTVSFSDVRANHVYHYIITRIDSGKIDIIMHGSL